MLGSVKTNSPMDGSSMKPWTLSLRAMTLLKQDTKIDQSSARHIKMLPSGFFFCLKLSKIGKAAKLLITLNCSPMLEPLFNF